MIVSTKYKKNCIRQHKPRQQQSLDDMKDVRSSEGHNESIARSTKAVLKTDTTPKYCKNIRKTFNLKLVSGLSNIEVHAKDGEGNERSNPETSISWVVPTNPSEVLER